MGRNVILKIATCHFHSRFEAVPFIIYDKQESASSSRTMKGTEVAMARESVTRPRILDSDDFLTCLGSLGH